MSFALNGTTDSAIVTAYTAIRITGDITVCLWAKWTSSQSSQLVARWGADQAYLMEMTTADKPQFYIRVSEVNKSAAAASSYLNQGWNHFAGVFNSTNVLMKVNGGVTEDVTGDASAGPIDNPADDFAIGRYNNAGATFGGSIADVCIFNRVLTNGEIRHVMKFGPAGVPGLQLWLPFYSDVLTENLAPVATKNNATISAVHIGTHAPVVYDYDWAAEDELVPDVGVSITEQLADTLALSDFMSPLMLYMLPASDTLDLTDAMSVLPGIPLEFSDTLSFTDVLTLVQLMNLIERSFTDSLSYADAILLGILYKVIKSDHFIIADEIQTRASGAKSASEQLNFNDAMQVQLSIAIEAADSNIPDDAIETLIPTLLTVSAVDTLAFTDNVGTTGVHLASYTTYLRRYLNDVIN